MNIDILDFSGTENHKFWKGNSFGNGISDTGEENFWRDFLINQGLLLFGNSAAQLKHDRQTNRKSIHLRLFVILSPHTQRGAMSNH